MSDEFEDDDLDFEDSNFDDFDKGEGKTLGDMWRNNPAMKFGIIGAGLVSVIGLFAFFGGEDSPVDMSYVPTGSTVRSAPGTEEVSPAYAEAVQAESERRIETAFRQGSSALPTPIAPPLERLDGEDATTGDEDPLARWRKLQEERLQRELAKSDGCDVVPLNGNNANRTQELAEDPLDRWKRLQQERLGQGGNGANGQGLDGNGRFGADGSGANGFGSGRDGNGGLGANGEGFGRDGTGGLGANGEGFGRDGTGGLGANGEGFGRDGTGGLGANGEGFGRDGTGGLGSDGTGANGFGAGRDGTGGLGANGEGFGRDGTGGLGANGTGANGFGSGRDGNGGLGANGEGFGRDGTGGLGANGAGRDGNGGLGANGEGFGRDGTGGLDSDGTGANGFGSGRDGTGGLGANGEGFGRDGTGGLGANGTGANGFGSGRDGNGGLGANGEGFGRDGTGGLGSDGTGANGRGFGQDGSGAFGRDGSGYGQNGQGFGANGMGGMNGNGGLGTNGQGFGNGFGSGLTEEQRAARAEALQAMAESMSEQMQAVLDANTKNQPLNSLQIADAKDFEQKAQAQAEAEAAAAAADVSAIREVLVPAGDILYAQLVTEANSDAPGPVMAQIMSGRLRGAKLLGDFETKTDLITLNFSTIVIDGETFDIEAVALDPRTTLSAMATDVDHRYLQRVFLPMAAAFVEGAANAISESGRTTITIQGETVSESSEDADNTQEISSGVEEAGAELREILDEEKDNVKTLVRIESGTPLGILFMDSVEIGPAEGENSESGGDN